MSEMIMLTTIDQTGFRTQRKDNWWIKPLLQGSVLGLFIIYSMWAAVFGEDHAKVEEYHYVSPFFNPEFHVSWWPAGVSTALMLIWAPVGFRGTCYYARKVYHRAFLGDPPACAVGELRKPQNTYRGETRIFLINNFHRYFLYAAIILALFHWYSFFETLYVDGSFTLGLGGIILGLDALFLSLYVTSCHSFKHLVGGGLNRITSGISQSRFNSWKFVKGLNIKHHTYFWLSLISVWIGDLYIRLVSNGTITDWRIIP